ncbi:MAG: DUF1294 domain-containing protein [Shewanella sp.]|nr:DUF1294 domain-containing protein [Shewanella sp.]
MRIKGTLVRWNEDKAYGFVQTNNGEKDIFIHKRAFINTQRMPKMNELISFELARDKQGRVCATQATFAGERANSLTDNRKIASKSASTLSLWLAGLFCLLLIFMTHAAHYFNLTSTFEVPIYTLYWYGGASLLTFLFYLWDKRQAQCDGWRVSEANLHTLSVIGGWPGAALAQHSLRHKTIKPSFRNVFWLTIILNITALFWLAHHFMRIN